MGDGLKVLSWPEQRGQLFASLSTATGSTESAVETVGGTLEALQRWMATLQCPDPSLSDRVELSAARLGYLCLVGLTDRDALTAAQHQALDDRFRRLLTDLLALIAEVEQSERDLHVDAEDSPRDGARHRMRPSP